MLISMSIQFSIRDGSNCFQTIKPTTLPSTRLTKQPKESKTLLETQLKLVRKCTLLFSLQSYQGKVTNLRPKDTEENPYFYTFKVQCTSCREVHPNWISFNRFRTHSASITNPPTAYEESNSKGQKVIEFDCRGLEFTEFKADHSKSIHKFKIIPLLDFLMFSSLAGTTLLH
ncbi:DUF866 domain-containing protein [Histoplasma capsulatum H143]|uniref:DUF866 domain-containing protein n=1 Tax=Ajellomyces capsulatus (strain H143) TaxID=544712 RepID=C6HMS4_AJECH|nr:DUF866 domain-containing protein [Histoplasma capsulatum H143]